MSKELETREPQPWEGRRYKNLDFAPEGTHAEIQLGVLEALGNDPSVGIDGQELADEVARRAYESAEGDQLPYGSGDVAAELERMDGNLLSKRPNGMLFRRTVELNTQ